MGTQIHPEMPRWPERMLVVCGWLASVSILQGVVDVVIPALQGREPFALLYDMEAKFGPWFLALWVFMHNLGLACLVPGIGFLAARFERRTELRGHIGVLLAGAVILSLAFALQYILVARERFNLAFALPLYTAEAFVVLVTSVVAARELWGFVPTRAYGWSLISPFRRVGVTLAAAAIVLAALAVGEAAAVT